MSTDQRLTAGTHSFTTSSGATLSYTVCGTGPRVLINVAPGWGCGSPLYENSFTFLLDAFTYVHLEVRGSRASSFPDDLNQMSSWHMSEDVESLRIYLGLDTIDSLLGHSNGGCITIWYALRHPLCVRSLVLVDTSVLGPEAEAVRGPATKAILDAHPDREAVAAAKKFNNEDFKTDEDMAKGIDAVLPLYFVNPTRHLENFRKNIMTNMPQLKCAQTLFPAEQQHNDQARQLRLLRPRTLVIVGRQDFVCPVPVSELITQDVQQATLCVIENSGHFPWIEQTTDFVQILKSFHGLA